MIKDLEQLLKDRNIDVSIITELSDDIVTRKFDDNNLEDIADIIAKNYRSVELYVVDTIKVQRMSDLAVIDVITVRMKGVSK